MNKKSFIKKLKNNLNVLEESEVKDIIEEYSDIIDEKIKDGKTEEEAIKDFGDINELSKEILKAYKINPKFIETDENSEIRQDFEKNIKKGAKKLSNFTKSVVDDIKKHDNITLEFICEIIIKIIILLVICAILTIPFWALLGLGHAIFNIAFFPLDIILNVLWGVLVWILYFAVGIMITIAMFKDNFKLGKEEFKKKTAKTKNNEEKNTDKVKIDETEMEENKKSKKKEPVKSSSGTVFATIKALIKIFIFIFFILPVIFIIVGLIFAIVGVIYYIIQGLNLWGVLILLIGLTCFFIYIYLLLKNLFEHQKSRIILILISAILVAIGTFVTFDTFKNIEIINDHHYENKKYEYIIDGTTVLHLSNINKLDFNEVESMEDGKIIVDVYYNDNYINIDYYESKPNTVHIISNINDENGWEIYNEIIDNLKENKLVDYDSAYQINYVIQGNSETLADLKIR